MALDRKAGEFRIREGRDPTRWERAAMEREAAADTRGRKTGRPVGDLQSRWREEARELGWTVDRLTEGLTTPAQGPTPPTPLTVEHVLDQLSAIGSTWTRADVLRAVCDLAPPAGLSGREWAATLDQVTDEVLEQCLNLDPDANSRRRVSDGRSVWLEPTSPNFTSPQVLAEEERILTWAMDAQVGEPMPSDTVDRDGLDVLQADAAAAVAGQDRLVLVVGPAGTGKTTMLRAAADDLRRHGRGVFGVAPTAKAARVLAAETGMEADTVAKLLHEWRRGDRLPDHRYRLAMATTVVVDEASMIGTGSLHQLIRLADMVGWRLVLVGDPRQLQAVGRGGLFAELCSTSRAHELVRIHRFTQPWEAAASLQLRAGQPEALDAYQDHGRIQPGTLDHHLDRIAAYWLNLTAAGRTVAVTASSNQHVDTLNNTIQQARLTAGHLHGSTAVGIAGGERAHVGETVVTRRNDRRLITNCGDTVRNRDTWTVTATHPDGTLTVARDHGCGTVILPADFVCEQVRLGYAATEHGHQGDTVDVGVALASGVTTHRGLYVATTRGRDENRIHLITDTNDPVDARDVLNGVLAHDRADIPAVTQRRHLAHAERQPARTQPDGVLPDWVEPWRKRVRDRRQLLIDGLDDREHRQASAIRELYELQPAMEAARDAWEPYARLIRDLEHELQTELRPAMWRANHDARQAGLGHRRSTQRLATDANEAVEQAQADIAAVHADGAPIKQHLDEIQHRAATLRVRAEPVDALDLLDRDEIRHLDQILDAADTYTNWIEGRRTPGARLAQAVNTLSDLAEHAPSLASHPGEPDKIHWYQLLDLALDDLDRQPALRPPSLEIDNGR